MTLFFLFSFFLDVGQTSANFLKLDMGARATSMGGAYTAISDDSYGIFYNPSSSGFLRTFDFSLMFLSLYNKINYTSLSLSTPLKNFGLGIGFSFLSFTDEKFISAGKKIGEYSCNDFLTLINFSYQIFNKISLGTNLKYIASRYDRYYAFSFASDFGILFNPIKNFYLGSSLLHLGTKRKFISSSDPLPLNLRTGVSYKIFFTEKIILTLSSDFFSYIDQLLNFSIGGEVLLKELRKEKEYLAIRAGYKTTERYGFFSGFSFGLGYFYQFLKTLFLQIDFTYLDYGYLGGQERVSLTFKYQLL